MAIPLAFTSDNTARFTGDFTSINPGGFGSNWCGSPSSCSISRRWPI